MIGPRTTIALAAAALMATLAATLLHAGSAQPDAARIGEAALPDLADRMEEAARLTVTTGTGRFSFARDGDGWVWPERDNFPVPAERVDGLLTALGALELAAPLTIRSDRYARLGLEGIIDPDSRSTRIDIETADGTPLGRLLLGYHRRGGLDGLYVRHAFAARSWLASGDIAVPDDPITWLDRRLVDIAPAEVAAVDVTDVGGISIQLARPDAGAGFAILDAADQSPAEALTGLFATLDFTDLRPAEEDGAGESLTIALTTFDGMTVRARFALAPEGREAPWVRFAASAGADATANEQDRAAELARSLGPWDYRLSDERLERIASALAALRGTIADAPP